MFLFAAALACAPGCSASRSTAPHAVLVKRDVTVLLTDSLGVPAAGLFVRATALPDSGGFGALSTGSTDDAGAVRFAALSEGTWAFACASGVAPGRAAGSTAVVPGAERAAAETLVVRLTLHTASSVTTRRTLSDAAGPEGTFAQVVETGALAITDAAGACTIAGLPPGRWTLAAMRYGYATHHAPFEVSSPGSALVLPDVTLRWLALPPDTGTGHH
ncbi:MAG: hypothetical protein HZA61_05190 [Candidatus Eisenbacteria bacterium]|uniref:Carboxypeptidase regulatory-like domain-containing protein n=1 Tax=Eiseniibacteriota bacterium TaxID=2212470 RepID=A0A933SCP9_UNCEI|nr:hypothetical protein [Candidatus Eisenbacteria bacterium]